MFGLHRISSELEENPESTTNSLFNNPPPPLQEKKAEIPILINIGNTDCQKKLSNSIRETRSIVLDEHNNTNMSISQPTNELELVMLGQKNPNLELKEDFLENSNYSGYKNKLLSPINNKTTIKPRNDKQHEVEKKSTFNTMKIEFPPFESISEQIKSKIVESQTGKTDDYGMREMSSLDSQINFKWLYEDEKRKNEKNTQRIRELEQKLQKAKNDKFKIIRNYENLIKKMERVKEIEKDYVKIAKERQQMTNEISQIQIKMSKLKNDSGLIMEKQTESLLERRESEYEPQDEVSKQKIKVNTRAYVTSYDDILSSKTYVSNSKVLENAHTPRDRVQRKSQVRISSVRSVSLRGKDKPIEHSLEKYSKLFGNNITKITVGKDVLFDQNKGK